MSRWDTLNDENVSPSPSLNPSRLGRGAVGPFPPLVGSLGGGESALLFSRQ